MVLSRFWLTIFISSIAFIVVSLFVGNSYTIDFVLNGKKDDPILISEKYINQIPLFVKDSIEKAPDQTIVINIPIKQLKYIVAFKNPTGFCQHVKTHYWI